MISSKSGYDVFLGGTTNKTKWREEFLNLINESAPRIRCFNPIVDNWTQECIELENFVKEHARYHIYVLTPRMAGVYSVTEMCDSVHDTRKHTVIYIMDEDVGNDGEIISWDPAMKKSLSAVANMIVMHGGYSACSISDMVNHLIKDFNSQAIKRELTF